MCSIWDLKHIISKHKWTNIWQKQQMVVTMSASQTVTAGNNVEMQNMVRRRVLTQQRCKYCYYYSSALLLLLLLICPAPSAAVNIVIACASVVKIVIVIVTGSCFCWWKYCYCRNHGDLKMSPVKIQCWKTKRIPAWLKTIYPNMFKTDFNLHNISLRSCKISKPSPFFLEIKMRCIDL